MTAAEELAVLAAIFACSEEIASTVRPLARWSRHGRGSALANQGYCADRCCVLVSGTAEVKVLGSEGQYVRIVLLEPGDVFGAYSTEATHSADVLCCDAVELATFDATLLRNIARGAPEIGSGLADRFARQYGAILRQFSSRITLSANGRVYERLLDRANGARRIAPAPVIAALAVEAQTTRETASRAISILERRGIIERTAGEWIIAAPRLIEDLVV
ncbi:Crp/Fnr family transcriptional regulator [Novosphingobium beihaiensis]|uniref:Crp/Fnr family transcriptional regulator n=1 Tax=Novosphingobium beihaiensis TaxID=2930389 RepID=A0ABT0BSI7_9SPHN|nr:Crp/Fnr family transcriptional regulator [Novosphingobium beihaiensis]MCJ2188035.1 Crp/Fnr family transcriptional regulator [Novosphingobium beihaiensis]